jgi:NAD dependent epimerase/dehydratase family enzyme
MAPQRPYIASSPNPVSQDAFMRTLRRAMGVRIALPATEWMVRFGAKWPLRTDPELALYGRYVVSTRLRDEHFEFQFPHLEDALADLLGNKMGTSQPFTDRTREVLATTS